MRKTISSGYFEQVQDAIHVGLDLKRNTWTETHELHPETSPESIRQTHLRLVRQTASRKHEFTAKEVESLSELLDLPAWNVRRALAALGRAVPETPKQEQKPRFDLKAKIRKTAIRRGRPAQSKTTIAIIATLAKGVPLTISEISNAIKRSLNHVRCSLNRNWPTFTKVGRRTLCTRDGRDCYANLWSLRKGVSQ